MQKKKVITFIVTAVVMTAFIIGAVFLYDYLRGDAPGNTLLRPPAGGQPGGTAGMPGRTEVPPPAGQGGDAEDTPPPAGQGSDAETPPPAGQGGNAEAPPTAGQGGDAEAPPAGGQGSGDAEDTPPAGQDPERFAAPDFTVQDADGNEVKLSGMQGKPVVLNFWASWCPPCKEEMPGFNNAFGDFGDRVHFMMVCLVDGSRETVETGAAYVEGQGYGFPVYFDVTGEAMAAYGIRAIPATYFIDAEGYLVTRAESSIPESTLRTGINYIITD